MRRRPLGRALVRPCTHASVPVQRLPDVDAYPPPLQFVSFPVPTSLHPNIPPTHFSTHTPFPPRLQFVEAALDSLTALASEDERLLRSMCLVGALPLVFRFVAPRWPASLRGAAARLLEALSVAGDDTLRCLVAAGGLKAMVLLVWDLHGARRPGATLKLSSGLSAVALRCLWRVLFAYEASLPLNSMCRLMAQAGLLPRLFAMLGEAVEVARASGASGHRHH
eukprot:365568-Chlamydomonas_euryale.AAC.1